MRAVISYVWLTALRDRLFIGLPLALLAVVWLAGLLGGTALSEQHEMTLSYAAGGLRMVLMVGLIIFTGFHVRRAFEQREIDVMLSRPLTRWRFVCAYYIGFAAVALALALLASGLLLAMDPIKMDGFFRWSASLLLESLIVVAIALFTSLILRHAVSSVMASLGFYLLMRMMGFFLATADAPVLNSEDVWYADLLLQALSVITPRLDLFTKSGWLIYGPAAADGWWILLGQTVVTVPLLLVAAMLDFRRRQF